VQWVRLELATSQSLVQNSYH